MPPSKPTPLKKQQSISSFFTPKTVNGFTDPRPANSSAVSQLGSQHHRDEDNDVSASGRSSGFSSKRLLEPDPTEHNSMTEKSSKKSKAVNDDDDGESMLLPETSLPGRSDLKTAGKSHNTGSNIPSRANNYLYDSSPADVDPSETLTVDGATKRQREQLHRKFVKRLGHPDSISQIKRRGGQISVETSALDEEDGDDAEDEAPQETKGRKKGTKTGKLTPMEIQMLEIKRKHMDALLIVEVGYKFKFFGEDARIAAKELSIVCIPGKFRFDEHPSEAHLDRFASASIPVHRLPVHAKRLVAAGHKVGVVRQIETAALKKAGDNRNSPFIRKLTNLYTKGTYIDDIDGLDKTDTPAGGAPATGYLLCLTEKQAKGWGTDEKVDVGILAVQPGTGDVIYDDFEDGFMRSEMETRLLHISPCELLIVGGLTKATEKLVQHLSGTSTNVFGDKIRVERVEKSKTAAAESYSHVAEFYAKKTKASGSPGDGKTSGLLDKVLQLCEPVTICLSAMIQHLSEYGLEHVFDLTKYFQSFSARSHMLLNGNTLTSLEIYQNQTDATEKGSLFWALNKTQTKFGQRLLRKWVGRPLLEQSLLEARTEAIEELKEGNQTAKVDRLRSLLVNIKSDLERSLIRIYYGKCTRPELLTVLQTMQRISNEFAEVKSPQEAGFRSSMINEAVAYLPTMRESIVGFLDQINTEAARSDDKYAFFREESESDRIANHKMGIAAVEQDLEEQRRPAATKINKKTPVTYVAVAGIEYLIEVDNKELKNIPASWVKISGTKKVSRFHTPEVVNMIRERDQHKESLAAACDDAFSSLLRDISSHYQSFRDCVNSLATLDCLLSLATVASQPGYVKPSYTSSPRIDITGGRHPMAEHLLLDAYVPNDTILSHEETRALLITGPNMGGKSSYVRQVALICIMAQIGSYVPAESATLGMLDAVYTRMGAFDNMMKGESTFMVELSETSDILKQATSRSLVILDELGRGTSTHDGVAIAQAVLKHIVRDTKCLTLFITHYQTLASVEKTFKHSELKNVHVKFVEDGEDITFLYEIDEGVAHRSYGLNVAKLARVPKAVLDTAAVKSKQLEDEVRSKMMSGLAKLLGNVLMSNDERSLKLLVDGVEQF